jgi:hypothetical protein
VILSVLPRDQDVLGVSLLGFSSVFCKKKGLKAAGTN